MPSKLGSPFNLEVPTLCRGMSQALSGSLTALYVLLLPLDACVPSLNQVQGLQEQYGLLAAQRAR